MSYDDAVNKSVKLHPPDREALDAVVEQSDEWGNDSAAIRGLIRQAADGETVTDGGTDRDETHHPEVDRLDAIYTAALQLVDHSHVLPDDDCAAVARMVANDGDNPWSPREGAVRRCLRRLRPGYVYIDHRPTSVRHTRRDAERTIYRLKPETAVPEKWKWHRKNVRERERKQYEARVERLTSPVDG